MIEKTVGGEQGQVARRVRCLVDAIHSICEGLPAAEKSMPARSCQVPVSRPTRFSIQAMAFAMALRSSAAVWVRLEAITVVRVAMSWWVNVKVDLWRQP
jgi:hypothetical protein